jgi:hypothetical protein
VRKRVNPGSRLGVGCRPIASTLPTIARSLSEGRFLLEHRS